jgi:hypothetical protein
MSREQLSVVLVGRPFVSDNETSCVWVIRGLYHHPPVSEEFPDEMPGGMRVYGWCEYTEACRVADRLREPTTRQPDSLQQHNSMTLPNGMSSCLVRRARLQSR